MAKIRQLPLEPENEPVFTCKKCGANICSDVSVTTHKFGGCGIGAAKVNVCKNCMTGNYFEL